MFCIFIRITSTFPYPQGIAIQLTKGKVKKIVVEKEVYLAPPEVQWAMNTALAYMGIHDTNHRKRALDIGNKLDIYKDYPISKGCTSPFAPIWIEEMVSRQKTSNR